MNSKEGNIVDIVSKKIRKGRVFYDDKIISIEYDSSIDDDRYILPGLVDAHVHIESSMLTPLEYAKVAVSHGVVAAVTDPHEIANVCGVEGIYYMVDSARKTPMKIWFGVPSCVPATPFETSGYAISSDQIEVLFQAGVCSHLSEMMNFPGVIFDNEEVWKKINVAKKCNKCIDGHAPMLMGEDLKKYITAGITTDHECTTLSEARAKIDLGMKIMLRQSSASRDFQHLISLISEFPDRIMFCTDDCHPDDLEKGYINLLVNSALSQKYDLFDVMQGAVKTASDHYNLGLGMLQVSDCADFIVVDNLNNFNVLSTVIDGVEVYDGVQVNIVGSNEKVINNFYSNSITVHNLLVKKVASSMNVIQVVEDSLITNKIVYPLKDDEDVVESNIHDDVLKMVVLNRYIKAEVSVGFVKGFNLKKGAIAGTIAHDSHNIIAVGVDDVSIIKAISRVQFEKGALVVVDGDEEKVLSLPVAGLMSNLSCSEVVLKYNLLSKAATGLGCRLKAPFMTLAFMSLLVIPQLKLGDRGLFDVNKFEFIDLQEKNDE
jgi:adenine deaminase